MQGEGGERVLARDCFFTTRRAYPHSTFLINYICILTSCVHGQLRMFIFPDRARTSYTQHGASRNEGGFFFIIAEA